MHRAEWRFNKKNMSGCFLELSLFAPGVVSVVFFLLHGIETNTAPRIS